jgi:N-acetylmuramoyl-L-alanine amidase
MNILKRHILFLAAVILSALVLTSCAPRYVIKDKEKVAKLKAAWKQGKDFPKLNRLDYQLPLYSKYLKDIKICLDPGHGGDAHRARYKRGPTDYREAVINLKVANYLKEFLESAGAIVILTRVDDTELSLSERVDVANEWGADLFLSIHHNAFGFTANRTTTWFHLDPDHRPANLDFARYIQQGVADALRLPQIDGNPLKSDQLMYKSGFGVLRGLNMVGCLCEASFFSHPYEEYRLKKDSYLKREAYGQFLGLSRYAWSGIPKAILIKPAVDGLVQTKLPLLKLKVDTGLRNRGSWGSNNPWIHKDSVKVEIDGKRVPCTFNGKTGIIEARALEPLQAGEHVVMGGFRNYSGNYSHPHRQIFVVDPPVGKIIITASPTVILPGPESRTQITVTVLDEDGLPVLDGTEVAVAVSRGKLEKHMLKTIDGIAVTYLSDPGRPGKVRIMSACEGRFSIGKVMVRKGTGK